MTEVPVGRRLDQRVVVATVFVGSLFITILDVTIVNVALPAIAADLGVGTSSVDAVVVSYLVSLAVVIPASGWLADRYGTKNVFLAAIAVFTAASVLCGLAQSMTQLVGFRVLQGVGGGLIIPVGTAMLYRAYPPERRAKAARVLMVPTVLSPSLGPVLGGVLTDNLSWHWVFFVNAPLGAAVFGFGLAFLDTYRAAAAGRFDVVGFVFAALGFSLVLYALTTGPDRGWGSAPTVAALALGVPATAFMVWWETRRKEPLIAFRVLRNRLFRTTNVSMFFVTMAFLGMLFLVPLMVQTAGGGSATSAGLVVFPEAVGVLVASQVAGWLYPRLGPRRLMAGGPAIASVMITGFALAGADASPWVLRALAFGAGFGVGFVFIATQAAAFATISAADTGHASTLFNVQRQLASALGVAVVATVLSVAGFGWAFVASAGLGLVAAVSALAVHDVDAANTMAPKVGKPSRRRRVGTDRDVSSASTERNLSTT